ncbi:MAG: TPM domain-containing protein [Bacillota bacterium]|nr:TPM domain-containing protein [Bacillota bacterium]
MNRFKGLIFLALVVAGIVFLVNSCSKDAYPRPSASFYLNDFAGALSGAAELYIVGEGEDLYEDTLELEDGGAQIVVATFMLEEGRTAADYDRTELFRQWKIGKNDMGILILLLFEEGEYGPQLVHAEIEAGYHIEGYEFAYDLDETLDQADLFEADLGPFETEKRIMQVYFTVLEGLYRDAYDTELIWDLEDYDIDYETYYSYSSTDSELPMDLIAYIFSPFLDWGSKIGYIAVTLLGIGLLGGFARTLGGGGSSGGFGFRRRR